MTVSERYLYLSQICDVESLDVRMALKTIFV